MSYSKLWDCFVMRHCLPPLKVWQLADSKGSETGNEYYVRA
jgi:hypothetical protein